MTAGASEARVATVPWEALEGLAPALAQPLAEVLAGAAAERAVDKALRRNRALTADQRQAVAEALFGVGLWRRRLRWAASEAAPPLALLATLVAHLGCRADAERLCGAAPARLPDAPMPPAVRWSFPDWLWQTLEREAGPTSEALADALDLPGQVCLRANTLRCDREALARRLEAQGIATRPGRLAPHCLAVVTPRANLWGSAAWQDGWFEVQDEGSQVLAELCEAGPGDAVLDACAGAGGKALALAAAVGPKGKVYAVDTDLPRLERLRTRAERAGAGNVSVCGALAPAGLLVPRVLVDAPCSELGALRRGPDLRFRLDPAAFAPLPALQRELLDRAALHLAPGGTLVYATCTFRKEENEDVAQAFEREKPELSRTATRALWPHVDGTDGFFAVRWHRRR